MTSELANWITVIGSLLSLIGVGIAIWQIQKTRRVAEAAKDASDQTQKIISRNLLLSNVSTCAKNLDEIKLYIQMENYTAAQLRINDLIANLIRIQQRAENTRRIVHVDFKETLAQLSIIRNDFEKKVNKKSARINKVRINEQLSKISDDLNKLIGGTMIAIEKGEENG